MRRGRRAFITTAAMMIMLAAGACRLGGQASPRAPGGAGLTPSISPQLPAVRLSTRAAPSLPAPATTAPPPTPAPQAASPTPGPSAGPPASPQTPIQQRTGQGVFEPAACDFALPPGAEAECGYLSVPEDRAQPESANIRLHVAIFRSRAADPAPDPLVYLSGGPGSSALDEARALFAAGLEAALEQRDLVLFDQRGTGHSQPRLDCPPAGGLQRCGQRLREEGVNLAAYHSAAGAADLEALRLALGYPQLNLYAVSYGTRLALTLIRDYPHAVRSAVLDSTLPLQAHLYVGMAANAQRGFEALFDLCAADPGCSAAYPNLEGRFYDLIAALEDDPATALLGPRDNLRAVKLDETLLIDLAYSALYNRERAGRIPRLIVSIEAGDYDVLEDWLEDVGGEPEAEGLQMAVLCNEEIPFGSLETALSAAAGVHPALAQHYQAKIQARYAVCQAWGLPPPDRRENEAVSASTPALVLAGGFDPITPPEWGRQAAAGLQGAFFYEFPQEGHSVLRSSPCALSLALAFWENPQQAPDPACIAASPGVAFALRP